MSLPSSAARLAAIGYCFGGMAVLEMARDGQNDLAGVVSFHGVLATPTPLKPNTYKGKILVLHGIDDPVVPDDMTMAFWKEMRDAKANWEFVAYGKALHTFTNWLMPEDGPPPAVYNKQADQRSGDRSIQVCRDHDSAADARGRERYAAIDLLPSELEREARDEHCAEPDLSHFEHQHGAARHEPVEHTGQPDVPLGRGVQHEEPHADCDGRHNTCNEPFERFEELF